MLKTIKRIVLWDFERASWQWDVLCLLIMCFIFLTPKSWFENKNPAAPVRAEIVNSTAYSADGVVASH